jgi:hypothetical protein
VACFATNLVRRRLNEIAPPGQLRRSVANRLSHSMNRSVVLATIIFAACNGACRRSSHQSTDTPATPNVPTALASDFETLPFGHGSGVDLRRHSNGATLRYGCQDRSSSTSALDLVRNERIGQLIEKTDVLGDNGEKIGERFVWDSSPPGDAEIIWNEGARLFYIEDATSLEDARAFEQSKFWVIRGWGCLDARRFQ